MSKEDMIELEGVVTEMLPESRFRVQLDNGLEILAYGSGKMKMHRIRVIQGDRVTVEMSPYDLRPWPHQLPAPDAQDTSSAVCETQVLKQGLGPVNTRTLGACTPPAPDQPACWSGPSLLKHQHRQNDIHRRCVSR